MVMTVMVLMMYLMNCGHSLSAQTCLCHAWLLTELDYCKIFSIIGTILTIITAVKEGVPVIYVN